MTFYKLYSVTLKNIKDRRSICEVMALPRYLYSVTNSMQDPLISASPSSVEQERELEGDVSVLHLEEDNLSTVAEDDGENRFGNGIQLELPGQARSDIYTSARLAAAGIPNPEAEVEEENALLGIHGLSYNGLIQGDSGPATKYGTNDDSPQLRRASPTVHGSRNSTNISK